MIVKEWLPLDKLDGLMYLQGHLIRTAQFVSLRSLGIEITIEVELKGTSALWVITRAD
jgi:hypothetical protein